MGRPGRPDELPLIGRAPVSASSGFAFPFANRPACYPAQTRRDSRTSSNKLPPLRLVEQIGEGGRCGSGRKGVPETRLRYTSPTGYFLPGLAGEGALQRQQFVEHRAQRVDVGAVIQLHPSRRNLLRAHVGRGAQERTGDGQARLLDDPRQTKVGDAQSPLVREHQVRRVDIAVDHTLAVRVVQPVGDLGDQLGHRVEPWATPGRGVAQTHGRGVRLGRRSFRHRLPQERVRAVVQQLAQHVVE